MARFRLTSTARGDGLQTEAAKSAKRHGWMGFPKQGLCRKVSFKLNGHHGRSPCAWAEGESADQAAAASRRS